MPSLRGGSFEIAIYFRMDIIGVKVIVLFLLGLTKVGFGLLPLLLHKYLTKRNKLKCLDRFIGEFKY